MSDQPQQPQPQPDKPDDDDERDKRDKRDKRGDEPAPTSHETSGQFPADEVEGNKPEQ